MKHNIKERIIYVFLLLIFLFVVVFCSGEPLILLNMNTGGCYSGMGNSGVADTRSIFSSLLNPGVLGALMKREIGFSSTLLYEDTNIGCIRYFHPVLEVGGIMGGLVYSNTASLMEVDNFNIETGRTFSYNNITFDFGYGKEIYNNLFFGTTLRFIDSQIYNTQRNYILLDCGSIYQFSNKLSFGISLKNILVFVLSNTDDKLSIQYKLGVSYEPVDNLTICFDTSKQTSNSNIFDRYAFGIDIAIRKYLSLRLGRNSFETTFGFGTNYKNVNFDYAVSLQESLGVSHKISMSYSFGKSYAELWAKKIQEEPTSDIDIKLVEAKLQSEEEKRKYFEKLVEEGISNYKTGFYKDAIIKFEQAKELDPNASDLNTYIDRVSLVGKIVDEIKVRDKVSALIARGVNYFVDGDFTNAVKVLNYALSLKPNDKTLIRVLTAIEEKTGIKGQRIILQSGLTIVDQKLNEALVSFREKDYAKVVSLCEDILLLEPENVVAYKRMGSAFFAMGERQKAKEMWQKALSLDPKDQKLRQLLNEMR